MRRLVLDIETVGCSLEELTESQREFVLRYAEKEKDDDVRAMKTEEAIRYLSLYPFTAKIVALGLLDIKSGKSLVLYEDEDNAKWTNEEKQIVYAGMTEERMLKKFWELINDTELVITFNGKVFDLPFIMLRSAMLKIKPTKNLISGKYGSRFHVDLLEKLTFYGSVKKFNLDFYCTAFGIPSPKARGIDGMEVKNLYESGHIKDIAVYCADDIEATFKLYNICKEYLNTD